jgi:hypothetical protein
MPPLQQELREQSFQVEPPVNDPTVQGVLLAQPADQQDRPGFRDPVFDLHCTFLALRCDNRRTPLRRSARNAHAFAADMRRKPRVREEDGPTASAATRTVMLARLMVGSSGMTLAGLVIQPAGTSL